MDYNRLDLMDLILWTFTLGAEGVQVIYRALIHTIIATKVGLECRCEPTTRFINGRKVDEWSAAAFAFLVNVSTPRNLTFFFKPMCLRIHNYTENQDNLEIFAVHHGKVLRNYLVWNN